MSVINFPGLNLSDVPGMLRMLADQIETGEYGEARGLAYAFLTDAGDVYCNSFGRISQLETLGMLQMANLMLAAEE